MRHRALLLAALLVLSVPLASSVATAVPIEFRLDSISVDYSSSWRSGLAIRVSSLSVDSYFELDSGESASMFPLQIGTPESRVDGRDDRYRSISAAFNVTVLDSGDVLTGTVTGTTFGDDDSDRGVVSWDGPVTLAGTGGVELQVAVSDASFSTPGDVALRTTFSRASSGSGEGSGGGGDGSNMPEPTSAVLFAVGGVAVRSAVRRRGR